MKRSSIKLNSEPVLVTKKIKLNKEANKKPKGNVKPKFEKKSKGPTMKSPVSKSPITSKNQKPLKSETSKQNNKNGEKHKFEKNTTIQKKGKLFKKKDKTQLEKSFPIGKDGKPEWNKVKAEKKKLKEDRRVHRSGAEQYELSVKAKSLWEKLRMKNNTKDKQEELVNELFTLLKGQVPNVVHSHDMARVVQWMLKLGSPSVRTSICEELSVNTVMNLQSKYASHCVKRALRYGAKDDRNRLIDTCNNHFFKLLNHSFACPVVELMYSTFASAKQRRRMHREMYGELHSLLPEEVTAIQNVPEDTRPAVLGATKANLDKILAKKQLLKYTLVQSILNDFLTSCSAEDRTEIFELIHGDILDLLNSKEGSRVALLTVWHGTNKIKKVIVKSLKGKVKEIACSEVGYILLMALFDCIDDTVLIKKALIPEILTEAEELTTNEWGRKVILYLVVHRDPAYFHPQQIEILSKGDAISTGKKDAALRKQEMLEAVSDSLLQIIAANPVAWFGESSIAMASLAIMKTGKGKYLQQAFEKLVDYILEPSSMIEVNNRQFHVIEDSAMHLVFKKLILQEKSQPNRTEETFSMILASRLTEENLKHILQFNRGCFLLVLLFESNNKDVRKTLKSKITGPMKEFLQNQETTGSKILLKKLVENE